MGKLKCSSRKLAEFDDGIGKFQIVHVNGPHQNTVWLMVYDGADGRFHGLNGQLAFHDPKKLGKFIAALEDAKRRLLKTAEARTNEPL